MGPALYPCRYIWFKHITFVIIVLGSTRPCHGRYPRYNIHRQTLSHRVPGLMIEDLLVGLLGIHSLSEGNLALFNITHDKSKSNTKT